VKIQINLRRHEPVSAVPPSGAAMLAPMVIPNKVSGEQKVVIVVHVEGAPAKTVLYFNPGGYFTWSTVQHLADKYTFVRLLGADESITITGAN